MFTFTDEERIPLVMARALSKDEEGREVLVGLTLDETSFVMERRRRFLAAIGTGERDRRDPASRDRFRELSEKHEKARLAVIGAEIDLRNENPTRH
jgi:hypothetical protein